MRVTTESKGRRTGQSRGSSGNDPRFEELDAPIEQGGESHDPSTLPTDRELEHLVTRNCSDLLTVLSRDGTCLYASGETMPILGIRPEAMRGRRLREFVPDEDIALIDAELGDIQEDQTKNFRYRLRTGDGTSRWVETRMRCSSAFLILATRDIDHEISRQSAEWTRLKLEARTDWLTQLKNRWGLEEILEIEFDRYLRSGRVFSIALLDVDGFKQVNDRHGHGFGDHVLRRIASTIEHSRRSYDVLGRWGGDEFLLILPETTLEEAERVAARMIAAIDHDGPELGEMARVTVSGGVIDSRGCEIVASMIDRADLAMYRAKSSGGNRVCTAETDGTIAERGKQQQSMARTAPDSELEPDLSSVPR
jgi:diguanylate cyclase (GGDEF)-like protein/PAS domain S-box-containing protein